jgi:hypothetical protein
MNDKDTKKKASLKDAELLSADSEIENWCKVSEEVSEEHSAMRTADDLLIDAWCLGSQKSNKDHEKKKK